MWRAGRRSPARQARRGARADRGRGRGPRRDQAGLAPRAKRRSRMPARLYATRLQPTDQLEPREGATCHRSRPRPCRRGGGSTPRVWYSAGWCGPEARLAGRARRRSSRPALGRRVILRRRRSRLDGNSNTRYGKRRDNRADAEIDGVLAAAWPRLRVAGVPERLTGGFWAQMWRVWARANPTRCRQSWWCAVRAAPGDGRQGGRGATAQSPPSTSALPAFLAVDARGRRPVEGGGR